jgi:hypothetical protein
MLHHIPYLFVLFFLFYCVLNVHVCTVLDKKKKGGIYRWHPLGIVSPSLLAGYTQIIYYNQVHVATRPFYQTFYTLYVHILQYYLTP